MEKVIDYLTNEFGEVTLPTDGGIEVDTTSITYRDLRELYEKLETLGMDFPLIEIYPAIHDRLVTIKIN